MARPRWPRSGAAFGWATRARSTGNDHGRASRRDARGPSTAASGGAVRSVADRARTSAAGAGSAPWSASGRLALPRPDVRRRQYAPRARGGRDEERRSPTRPTLELAEARPAGRCCLTGDLGFMASSTPFRERVSPGAAHVNVGVAEAEHARPGRGRAGRRGPVRAGRVLDRHRSPRRGRTRSCAIRICGAYQPAARSSWSAPAAASTYGPQRRDAPRRRGSSR